MVSGGGDTEPPSLAVHWLLGAGVPPPCGYLCPPQRFWDKAPFSPGRLVRAAAPGARRLQACPRPRPAVGRLAAGSKQMLSKNSQFCLCARPHSAWLRRVLYRLIVDEATTRRGDDAGGAGGQRRGGQAGRRRPGHEHLDGHGWLVGRRYNPTARQVGPFTLVDHTSPACHGRCPQQSAAASMGLGARQPFGSPPSPLTLVGWARQDSLTPYPTAPSAHIHWPRARPTHRRSACPAHLDLWQCWRPPKAIGRGTWSSQPQHRQ